MKLKVANWISITCLCSVLQLALFSSISLAQPQLQVDQSEIDVGELYGGDVRELRVQFMNTGNATLVLEDIQPSCRCLSVANPLRSIAPSDTQTVLITFDSEGFRGEVQKYIDIFTNEPDLAFKRLWVKAKVLNNWLLDGTKKTINFGSVEQGSKKKQLISLINTSTDTLLVSEVYSNSENISAQYVPKKVLPDEKFTFLLELEAHSLGFFKKNIYVKTNSLRQPLFSIKTFFRVN